ncbi:MAG: sulfotransferase domain-containing protein, partial [Simkaniaceae bacterium]|nr:sulfotransferase domain-containing protein [Simkaniaceae bacterium]
MRRFFTLLFCIPFLCAVTKKSIGATADVLVQTIPKGGSHLLVNILEEMSNEKKLTFYWAHFSQGQWYKTNAWIYSYLLKHQAKKKIVMVRDYRDVIVSLMHYLDQAVIQASIDPKVRKIFTWFHLTYRSPEISVWKKLKTQEQKIDHLLDPVGNFLGQSLYQAFFDSQNLWKTKNTLFLRYEDFIDGNGDEQVARVAKFVHRKPFPLSKVYGGLGFSSGGHFRNGK